MFTRSWIARRPEHARLTVMLSRRHFLQASAAAVTIVALPSAVRAGGMRRLTAAPARLPVVGAPHPETDVWAYDGRLPGPLLRVKQGQRLRVRFENRLPQDSTVHWHGIRLPNAMDGVPGLTQDAVKPGAGFDYDFACEDAGTFWYHPHWGSAEQVGRGLSGMLVVDEAVPPVADRDVAWVLGDLRLDRSAQITADFRNPMDLSHGGRFGNTPLFNGRLAGDFALRAGERLRLRLLNTANARIFELQFGDHAPWLIALDGHPVPPRRLGAEEVLLLGPGMRADLMLDATGMPGSRHSVIDTGPDGRRYRLVDLVYDAAPPLRRDLPPVAALAPNPVAEPDLAAAERLPLVLGGGAMGGLAEMTVDGQAMGLREAFQRHRVAWALNGQAHSDGSHMHAPLFSLARGRSYVFAIDNDTAWPHPVHLHGHTFRVLSEPGRPFRDTVLVQPRQKAEIAFVADNPGDWMLHCHILEHQAAGMMATVRVA